MRSLFQSSLPFAAMLCLALGSVVFSCSTTGRVPEDGKPFFVNTGIEKDGSVRTIQTLARIDKILLIDEGDRSRRTEVPSGAWSYDRESSELRLARESPYRSTIVHVEGLPEAPARFVMPKGASLEETFVAVEGRMAIRGYDYSISRSCIVFRKDFDPAGMEYCILFKTPDGSSSMSNWRSEDSDALAYLQTQYFADALAKKNRETKMDYFLDPSSFEDGVPRVVYRDLSPEEIAASAGSTLPVMKPRFSATDEALSKEVGFDARLPKSVGLGAGRKNLAAGGRMIEESQEAGALKRVVTEFYGPELALPGESDSIEVRLSASALEETEPADERLIVERARLVLGVPVDLVRAWAIHLGPGGEEPAPVVLATYSWKRGGVYSQVSCEDVLRSDAERLVSSIVAQRF
jgi:hypothetical protein